jgi:hypothetical protein
VSRLTTQNSGALAARLRPSLLQRRFAAGLSGRVVGAERGRQQRVDGRVPDSGVDTVEDALEFMGPAAQQAVEAAALVVVLDLAGVAGAHGADPVGVVQPGLHEVEAAVELDAVHREVMGRQAQLGKVGSIEDAL